MFGFEPDGEGGTKPGGYRRTVISTLRPYGWATLYWHAKSRTYRVKVNTKVKGQSEKKLLMDAFARASGLVSLCACGVFFPKLDGRQRYCSPKCADKYRARRARQRHHSATAKGQAQIQRAERAFADSRRRLADGRAAAAYVAEQIAEANDQATRREQHRLRNNKW
jgi:hypothetical protein